jgi:endo-1,4-beta-mannosidase
VGLARRHHIDVQIAPLTGWMSGYFVLPPWARGDVFTDPKTVAAEQRLVHLVAEHYRDNPAVQGYDFGNELNVFVEFIPTTIDVPGMERWMDGIYRAFKTADPESLVTNGIGTGFTKEFNVEAIARTSDYMSVHSYPWVHRTGRMDPPVGQRTTYSLNYMIEWAATTGKPVLVQETGATSTALSDTDMSRFLSVTLHLAREAEEVVVLVNHTNTFQDAVVSCPEGRTFRGIQDPGRLLSGRDTHLRLAPGEVAFFVIDAGPVRD